jgi:hypothetical protein
MDLYITFYKLTEKTKCDKRSLLINNGFSFGRIKKSNDIDLFINVDDFAQQKIQENIKIYNPEKIWITVTFNDEAKIIKNIADERWIIGGPLITENKNNEEFFKIFTKKPTFVFVSMEKYLGNEISSDFDLYFSSLIEQYPNYAIHYNLNLGLIQCYWSKCSFCKYSKVPYNLAYKRNNIEKIIKSAIPYTLFNFFVGHVCLSAPTPKILKEIINAREGNSFISTYIRADKPILDVIQQYDDLSRFLFMIGIEGFSQSIVDELNKGYETKLALHLVE